MELGSTVCAVRSKRVLVGDEVRPAVIVIKDGKIHQILSDRDFSEDVTCEVSWLSLVWVSGYWMYRMWHSWQLLKRWRHPVCNPTVMAGVGCGWQCGDARHRRLPCSCEWTRPHLLGGLLDRHQGCCSWRGDDDRGHAAVSWRLPPPKINQCPLSDHRRSLGQGKSRRVNRLRNNSFSYLASILKK